MDKHDLLYKEKDIPLWLEMVDGTTAQGYGKGILRLETLLLPVNIKGFKSQHSFTIMDMGGLEAIIGYDWLLTHNLDINWIN